MLLIIITFILIIVIISIIIPIINKKKNCEKFENTTETKISPIVEIAKEHSKLQILKDENESIQKVTNNLQLIKNDLENKIKELKFIINEKTEEKLKLENNINEINKQKENSIIAFQILKDRVDATTRKENELLIKEENLNKILLDIPKLSEIKCNQEIINIQKQLESISKSINNDDFCLNTNKIPEPNFKNYNEKNNDLTYKWCLCNDNNKNSEECISYIECKNNYDLNKNKSDVIGDDLDIYFKCIDRYNTFPKYLNKN